jgi:hypothetical protein
MFHAWSGPVAVDCRLLCLVPLLWIGVAAADSGVAVVGSHDGRVEVFLAHADPQGGVFHRYQTSVGGANAPWSEWRQIAPAPTGAQSIVAARDGGGRITVGWLSGGSIWIASAAAPGSGLSPARRLDTNGLRTLALVANPDGRLEFLALSDAGAVWSIAQPAVGAWDPLNVHALEGSNLRQISATSYGDGRLALVALGGDGRVYWRAQLAPNSGWGPWRGLEGVDLRAVVAGANADGRMEVLAVGGDRGLWHRWEVPGGGWSGWSYLAPGPMVGQPVFVSNHDGRLEAFTIGSTTRAAGHIWQKAPNSGWHDAVQTLPFGDPTDDLAVARLSDGRLVAASADFGACTATTMVQEEADGRFIALQSLGRACAPPPPTAKINWLTANPDYLPAGSSTRLAWSVGTNQSCNPFNLVLLRQVFGKPDQPVTISAAPEVTTVLTATTTFRLTVSCPGTGVSDFKTVLVTQSPPSPTPQSLVVFINGPFTDPDPPKENTAFQARAQLGNVGTKTSDRLTVKFFVDGAEKSQSSLQPLAPGEERPVMSSVPPLTGFVHDLEWRIVENGQSLFGQIAVYP